MARPTKLTQEVQNKICGLLRLGNYFSTACRAAGIKASTGYNWLTWGEDSQSKYHAFYEAVDQADAEGEALLLATVRSHGVNWQAAMTMLERKYKDKWGRVDQVVTDNKNTITSKAEVKGEINVIERADADRVKSVLLILADAGAIRVATPPAAGTQMDAVYPPQTQHQAGSLSVN